jgi:hypothetical protein
MLAAFSLSQNRYASLPASRGKAAQGAAYSAPAAAATNDSKTNPYGCLIMGAAALNSQLFLDKFRGGTASSLAIPQQCTSSLLSELTAELNAKALEISIGASAGTNAHLARFQ